MNFNIRNRFIIFALVFMGLFSVLFVQLIKLTVVQGATYAEEAGKLDKESITLSGARGSILDRNGLPLAYDVKSYNVQFYKDPTKTKDEDRAYYTDVITKTIKMVEDNGGKTIDTFAIKYNNETGEYYFDWGDIKEDLKAAREKNWRANMYVGDKRTPEQIYLYLRGYYQIPSEVDYNEARKILSVWQEVQLASWTAYNPIVVAYNVNTQTVAEIETHSNELTGMSIAEGTTRIYPRDTLAANVIGYLGRVVDPNELKAMQAKGYSVDDMVGVSGIEETMEQYLTGNSTDRQGVEQVEVDNYKVVKNVLSATQAKQGDNVELTIDIPLQQAVEASLAKEIPKIRDYEEKVFNASKDTDRDYKTIKSMDELKLAESGAAVVLDVNTGEVLAMASYPSFDPNLFIQGMTDAEYEANGFKDKDKAPLMNKAISSRDTPGSIFKMVTGLGALMQNNTTTGTTLNEKIHCEYNFTANTLEGWTGKKPHDWDKSLRANPQSYNIIQGLEHSCDYYFFTLASRLGIDLIDKWGEKYGLTSSTGIELPGEAIGYIGNQKILYDGTKSLKDQVTYLPELVKNGQQYGLKKTLKIFAAQRKVSYSEDVYDKTSEDLIALAGLGFQPVNKILSLPNGKTIGDCVRDVLSKDMQIRASTSRAYNWDGQIAQLITSNLIWSPYMTITTGIGQGVVQVTPIAVARYVAAVANGGTVYETHIVKKIVNQDGQTVLEQKPVVYDTLDAPNEYLEALRQGMAQVVSGEDGTAKDIFKGFDYQTKIAGKTGTAQVSNIDLEDNSWFVSFAPYDANDPTVKPEIAIVVYIPHGYKGGYGGYVVKDIVQFYLDREKLKSQQDIPSSNSLVK